MACRRYYLFVLILLSSCWEGRLYAEEQAIDVYPIDASEGLDLSGLAICDGKLLTVADNISDTIFEVVLDGGRPALVPHLQLAYIPPKVVSYDWGHMLRYYADAIRAWDDRMDWEGIACYGGMLYLVSERKSAILLIEDGRANWLGLDIYRAAKKQGFLRSYNGFIEAIAITDDRVFGFFERQERGAFSVDRRTPETSGIKFYPLPNDMNLAFRKESRDIAGVYVEGRYIYTLERNASAVCKRRLDSFKTLDCLSYFELEESDRYSFDGSTYGLGEGLSMDSQFLYIVFDNNRRPRHSSGDRRSLLLVFPRPVSW